MKVAPKPENSSVTLVAVAGTKYSSIPFHSIPWDNGFAVIFDGLLRQHIEFTGSLFNNVTQRERRKSATGNKNPPTGDIQKGAGVVGYDDIDLLFPRFGDVDPKGVSQIPVDNPIPNEKSCTLPSCIGDRGSVGRSMNLSFRKYGISKKYDQLLCCGESPPYPCTAQGPHWFESHLKGGCPSCERGLWNRWFRDGRLDSDLSSMIPDTISRVEFLRHAVDRRISQQYAMSRGILLVLAAFLPKLSEKAYKRTYSTLFKYSHAELKQQLTVAAEYLVDPTRTQLGKLPGVFYCIFRLLQHKKRGCYRTSLSLIEATKVSISDDVYSVTSAINNHSALLSTPIVRNPETVSRLLKVIGNVVEELVPDREQSLDFDMSLAPKMKGGYHVTRSEGISLSLFKKTMNTWIIPNDVREVVGYQRLNSEAIPLYGPVGLSLFHDIVASELPSTPGDVEQQFVFTSGKCRIVTKCDPYSAVFFQGLQTFLFKTIWKNSHFRFTGESFLASRVPEYMVPKKGELFVNGDLKSATDRFSPIWTSFTLERILSRIGRLDLLESALSFICPEHMDTLEGGRKLALCNGQMMGNPLSFPILCIISASIGCLARRAIRLEESPILVNGDDISLRIEREDAMNWHKTCEELGLQVSYQKTSISDRVISLNSHAVDLSRRVDLYSIKVPAMVGLKREVHRFQLYYNKGWNLIPSIDTKPSILEITDLFPRLFGVTNPSAAVRITLDSYGISKNKKRLFCNLVSPLGEGVGVPNIPGVSPNPEYLYDKHNNSYLPLKKRWGHRVFGIGGLGRPELTVTLSQSIPMNICGIPVPEIKPVPDSVFDLFNQSVRNAVSSYLFRYSSPMDGGDILSLRRREKERDCIPVNESLKTRFSFNRMDGIQLDDIELEDNHSESQVGTQQPGSTSSRELEHEPKPEQLIRWEFFYPYVDPDTYALQKLGLDGVVGLASPPKQFDEKSSNSSCGRLLFPKVCGANSMETTINRNSGKPRYWSWERTVVFSQPWVGRSFDKDNVAIKRQMLSSSLVINPVLRSFTQNPATPT